ncbi:putative protein TIFY 3A-like [Capsicum annuum]|nr:putative protein TIFY 3A-like [Capsicum annuum]
MSNLELAILPKLVHDDDTKLPVSQREKGESEQLTIFYAGIVHVYDNIPAEKAESIINLARESCSQLSGSTVAKEIKSTHKSQVPSVCKFQADLPIARRKSLERFFEKRHNRITSKQPYASPAITQSEDKCDDESMMASGEGSPRASREVTMDALLSTTKLNQPIQIDDVEGEGPYGGEGLYEATLFVEFVCNRKGAYGGGHRGRRGGIGPAPYGRGWGHKASECPNQRNIVLMEGDPYFVRVKMTKSDVSEGTLQEDDGDDGEPERVVEEGKVNVPCGLMRKTPHDDAWPEEGEVLISL